MGHTILKSKKQGGYYMQHLL